MVVALRRGFVTAATSLTGVGIIVWLVWLVGYEPLLASLRFAGWSGLFWLCLASVPTTVLLGAAWRALIPIKHRVPLKDFILGRMVRDAVADISPLTVVGGMMAAIRIMILRKLLPAYAFASTAVDATTETLGLIAFIAFGFAISFAKLESIPADAAFNEGLAAATVALLIVALLAFVLSNGGWKPIKNFALRLLPQLKVEATSTWALYEMFGSYRQMAISCALHFAAWTGGGCITYLAFVLVGAEISFLEALAIDALLCMIRSAAFFVPASLGVQEAGFALIAPLFGVPAELGLAASLLRRAREIIAGLPALLLWQVLETKGFWQRTQFP